MEQHKRTLERDFALSRLAPDSLGGLAKDVHLIVAALEHGDGIVISNDRRAARGFMELARVKPEYKRVNWWGSDRAIPMRSEG